LREQLIDKRRSDPEGRDRARDRDRRNRKRDRREAERFLQAQEQPQQQQQSAQPAEKEQEKPAAQAPKDPPIKKADKVERDMRREKLLEASKTDLCEFLPLVPFFFSAMFHNVWHSGNIVNLRKSLSSY